MSKPPLIIPNRRGTALWPAAMQIPTVVQYSFDERGTDGWNGSKEALARAVMTVYAGQVKQFFLKQTAAADLSSVNYVSFDTQIVPGVRARYRRNFTQATLQIHIEINVVLANPEIDKVTPLIGDYVLISYTATEESGFELDTLTGFADPLRTPLGWASQLMGEFRYSGGPESSSIIQGITKEGGAEILRWYGDYTYEEYATATLKPFKERNQKIVNMDLYAYWYDVKFDGKIRIDAELLLGDRPIIFNASNIYRNDRVIATATLEEVVVDPEWSILGEVKFVPESRQIVQLIARLQIDMEHATLTLTEDKDRPTIPLPDLGIPFVTV